MSASIYYERDEYGSVSIEVEAETYHHAAQVWIAIYDYVEGADE